MQKDLKRVVAFSSVAHLGFIVLGTFSLTTQGVEGAVVQMVNHGITTPALFLLVGMIYERRHTRQIAELSGLQRSAPILAGVFTLVMLSSIGAFKGAKWWGVVAAAGVILAALYMLWAYQRVFHGKAEGENATMPDLRFGEGMAMAPLCILIVFLGVYPKPLLDRIEPAVKELIAHVGKHDPTVNVTDVPAPAPVPAAPNGEGH
jgi:NADH-quinone oxidoreductase subunit M